MKKNKKLFNNDNKHTSTETLQWIDRQRERNKKKRSHEKHEQSPKLGQNELLVRSREGAREVGGKMALGMTWLATTNPFHLIKKKISS